MLVGRTMVNVTVKNSIALIVELISDDRKGVRYYAWWCSVLKTVMLSNRVSTNFSFDVSVTCSAAPLSLVVISE